MRTTDYLQDVTYWSAPTIDGWGEKTFGAPQALKCRWEGRGERFIDMTGEDTVSRAIVWVKEPVDLGGYLYLGLSSVADPTDVLGAYEIRMLFEIPDLRNVFIERRAFL